MQLMLVVLVNLERFCCLHIPSYMTLLYFLSSSEWVTLFTVSTSTSSWVGILGCWELMYIKDLEFDCTGRLISSNRWNYDKRNWTEPSASFLDLGITHIQTLGLQCLYKARQQPSFWEKKKRRRISHPLSCLFPVESHECYTRVEHTLLMWTKESKMV